VCLESDLHQCSQHPQSYLLKFTFISSPYNPYVSQLVCSFRFAEKKCMHFSVPLLSLIVFFPVALQPDSGHGLLFDVSLILLDTWQNSFGRVTISSQRPLPTQESTTYKHKDKHPCPEQNSNPRSQQPNGQDLRLRPRCHRDRPSLIISPQ
jgi:hypothetical protein